MIGLDFDTVTALLACAGEATLWYACMQLGLLEKVQDDVGFPIPSVRPDENHVAVVQLGDFPQRLVYDEDFGWLWYNAVEGPEDDPA